MAVAGVKYDDGSSNFTSNCFPVRSFYRLSADAEGAWLTAFQAEQRRRFKAILCSQPKTYSQIREERKRCEREGTKLTEDKFKDEEDDKTIPILDGFFLMKHCCVEDPSDLCSLNIAGKELSEVREEDFALFDNVAYINAAENYLPLEAFRGFPTLRELEMPLNGLRGLNFDIGHFPYLELLDVSFNNLSQDDVLLIGLLQNLKVLHLSGNNFTTLPADMALPYISKEKKIRIARYPKLEVLMLDDNKLSDLNVFAALAGLQRLKHLNLEKNLIYYIPQLKSVEGKVVPEESKPILKPSKSAKKSDRLSHRSLSDIPRELLSPKRHVCPDKERNEEEEPRARPAEIESGDVKEKENTDGKETIAKDLLNDDLSLNLGDITARMNALQNSDEYRAEMSTQGDGSNKMDNLPEMSLCAFPELCHLNLSHNKIMEEEGLLAVAAWPMLVELLIHDNPLTNEMVGDPPLLKIFLQDRLGIKMVRKPKPPVPKPTIEVPQKKHRKVSDIVPRVPKPKLQIMLMLGHPERQHKAQKGGTANLNSNRPLPPISSTSNQNDKEEGDDEDEDDNDFFMTQVNDQKEEEEQPSKEKEDKGDKPETRSELLEKFEGYEELLMSDDDSEDEDICPPKDIQSNLRALKLMLNNELVYRSPAARLDRVPREVKEYRRVPVPPPPRKTRAEKVDELLHALRDRSTVEEKPLEHVLRSKKREHRRSLREAETLLAQIQNRYNAVRVSSMKEAQEKRTLMKRAVESVHSASREISRISSSEVMST